MGGISIFNASQAGGTPFVLTPGNGTSVGADKTSVDLGQLKADGGIDTNGFNGFIGDVSGIGAFVTIEANAPNDGVLVLGCEAIDGISNQEIRLDPNGAGMIVDDNVNMKGLETNGDYSANFTDNSYVTMAWVMANFIHI